MSQFVSVISANRRDGKPIIEHYNFDAIHVINFGKNRVGGVEYDVVNVWTVNPDGERREQLFSRSIEYREDAQQLLESVGFNMKLFDRLKFEFDGSVLSQENQS